jgi:predicted glycosyltransferase
MLRPEVTLVRADAQSQRRGPRFAFYNDGAGLGHRQRNLKLARGLLAAYPDARILLMTPAHDLDGVSLAPSIELLELDEIAVQLDVGAFEPRVAGATLSELAIGRATTILAAVKRFRPDVMVVDDLPTGVEDELLPTFAWFRQLGAQRPKVILGLRDILHEPPSTRIDSWQRTDTYLKIAANFDHVLVYGSETFVPTAERYGLAAAIGNKLTYCGYVAPTAPLPDRHQARQVLGVGERALVVVTGGGGIDALPMMRNVNAALSKLAPPRPRAILLTGPRMREADRACIERLAARSNAEVRRYTDNPLPLFAAADLLVAQAGYNTLIEALALGSRLLLVPRPWGLPGQALQAQSRARRNGTPALRHPVGEQAYRAELFAKHGLADAVSEDATPNELAAAISKALVGERARPRTSLPLDGVANAVELLQRLLGGSS